MSLRQPNGRLGLPTTHYFVSISHGDSIRTARIRPAALWALIALAPLMAAFGLVGAADLALRLHEAAVLGQVATDATIEDRQAAGRASPDPEADQQRAGESAIEDRIRDLAARQARLEKRDALVAALSAETTAPSFPVPSANARSASAALGAIETLGPKTASGPAPANPVDDGAARAYAPEGASLVPKAAAPRPFDQTRAEPAFAPGLAAAAWNPDLDPSTRLDLLVRSFDRLENRQIKTLAAIDRRASAASERNAAILAAAGLDPMKLAEPKPLANVGGPFIPIEAAPKAPAFDRAAAHVARDVSFAEKLKALMPFVPLREPLSGEASVSSPFGYRIDPFLGRPELHPGVDLVQPYGSEIRATGAGRVVHAGPMGGYGDMVEIDHGFGLSTRYGHMSEILVAEGQEVARGEVLGRLGSSGRSTGPHLHYEVRVDGEPVDPERFMLAEGRAAE